MLLLLIRHGSTDRTSKQLIGRTPGVHLNQNGLKQANALIGRLEGIPVHAIYSSPMERAVETAAPVAEARELEVRIEDRLNEVDYGEWSGRDFKALRRTDLWKRVQQRPADARFPGGEAMREAQVRVVGAIESLAVAHPKETVAAFSHGDVIKAAIAHLVGMHLDMFQRLHVAPASVSALLLGAAPPVLVALNDVGGMANLVPRSRRRSGQN